MDSKNHNLGFTLVEMIIAMSLFLVVVVIAYSGFRSGFIAYQRIETGLAEDYEFKMFAREITQELRNSVEYAPVPFKGKSDGIQFPTRLKRYQGVESDMSIYEVTYRFKSGKLERTEGKLQKGLTEPKKEKEELFSLDSCRFQFAYEKNGTIEWRNEWSTTPYLGIPRGVQITFKIKGQKEDEKIQILIPQGLLGAVK